MKKTAKQSEVFRGGISRILSFLIKNSATELSTFDQVMSQLHWKNTVDLTEIVNNYDLKWEAVFRIVEFIYHFSVKLLKRIWKYFQRMVLRCLGRDYYKKIGS